MLGTVAWKEWKTLFRSPLTWVALAVIQVVLAWLYLVALEEWLHIQSKLALRSDNPGLTAWLIDQCFAPASTVLMAITPLITMRLLADERRGSGIELLLSSPVSASAIVAGKYTAALGIYLLLLLQLVLMPLTLAPVIPIDYAALALGFLGLLLFSAACAAIGVFFSSITRQAAVAALGCFGALFLLWVAGTNYNSAGEGNSAFTYLSLAHPLRSFMTGLFRSSDAIYYLLISALFLAVSTRHIDNLRSVTFNNTSDYLRNGLFIAAITVLTGLTAWISHQNSYRVDVTAQARHSLSPNSVQIVQSLPGPVTIDAWVPPAPETRRSLREIIARYQHYKADISINFINPETSPAAARENAIAAGGELIVHWQDREQRLQSVTEKTLSYALLRLSHSKAPVIRFVTGHLERAPDAATRNGYQQFCDHLRTLGFVVDTISLITQPRIPEDTDLLVIAAPTGGYFPGEVASVLNFIANGGNVLWLLEPQQPVIPAELAGELGLSLMDGVIVDIGAQQLAVNTPDFALVDQYPPHPALPDQLPITLFPQAAGIRFPAVVGWEVEPLLITSENSWTETGPIAGQISFDENTREHAGPIMLGAALQRSLGDLEQRAIVIGDADFLANSWLGNGGNLFLGQQLINWLSSQQPLPAIAPLQAADAQLNLSRQAITALGLGFLILLPGAMIVIAFISWRRGRQL